MYTTVNEAAKMFSPLSNNISSVILSIVSKTCSVINFFQIRNEHKELMKVAESLKGEYPFESVEYVATIIKNEYGA